MLFLPGHFPAPHLGIMAFGVQRTFRRVPSFCFVLRGAESSVVADSQSPNKTTAPVPSLPD